MKRKTCGLALFGAALGGFLLGMLMTGCSHLKQIPAAEFKNRVEMNRINTLSDNEYLGQAHGKAYLVYRRAPLIGHQWRETILFTPAAELGPDFLQKLEGLKTRHAGPPRQP